MAVVHTFADYPYSNLLFRIVVSLGCGTHFAVYLYSDLLFVLLEHGCNPRFAVYFYSNLLFRIVVTAVSWS
jgi:hypothetical protein